MLQTSLWFSWGFGDRGSSCRCFSCWCSSNRPSSVAVTFASTMTAFHVVTLSVIVPVISANIVVPVTVSITPPSVAVPVSVSIDSAYITITVSIAIDTPVIAITISITIRSGGWFVAGLSLVHSGCSHWLVCSKDHAKRVGDRMDFSENSISFACFFSFFVLSL